MCEKIQVYLSQKYKIKQTLINQSLQHITMHAGHILTILIGFYASFAVTVMSVTPLLGWTTNSIISEEYNIPFPFVSLI